MKTKTSSSRRIFTLIFLALSALFLISSTTNRERRPTSRQDTADTIQEIMNAFVEQLGVSLDFNGEPTAEYYQLGYEDNMAVAYFTHEYDYEFNMIYYVQVAVSHYDSSQISEDRLITWRENHEGVNYFTLTEIQGTSALYASYEEDDDYIEGAIFACGEWGVEIQSFTVLGYFETTPPYPTEVVDDLQILYSIMSGMGLCNGGDDVDTIPPDSSSSSGSNCSNACSGITLTQMRDSNISTVRCKASCFGFQPAGSSVTYSEQELADCLTSMETAYQNCLASSSTTTNPPSDSSGGDFPPEQVMPVEPIPGEDILPVPEEYPMEDATLATILATLSGSALVTFLNWMRDRDLTIPFDGTVPSPISGGGMVDPDVAQRQGALLDKGWQWNATNNRFEPKIGTVDENGNVWCQPPWDEGGPGWMSKRDFENMRSMQSGGYQWGGEQYGWVTPQEYRDRVAQYEHFQDVNRQEQLDRMRKAEAIRDKKAELAELEKQRLRDNDYARKLDRSSAFGWESQKIAFKSLATGTDSDGNFSWSQLGARVALGAVTGGASEYVLMPAMGAYGVHDRMAAGMSMTEAAVWTGAEMWTYHLGGKYIIGPVLNPVLKAGGKAAAYVGGKFVQGAKAIGTELGILGKAAKGGSEALSQELRKEMGWAIGKATASGDEKAILALYEKYGMNNMSKLQQEGLLKTKVVREMNKAVQDTYNKVSTRAANNVAQKMNEKAGSQVMKKTYLGDSGSQDTVFHDRPAKTDADRTLLGDYDKKFIDDVARTDPELANLYKTDPVKARNMAYDKINSEAAAMHEAEVQRIFQKEYKISDVKNTLDAKTYPGMGQESGYGVKGDSFPPGMARTRQAVMGKTTVVTHQADGSMRTYQTSGEAMVDANALNKAGLADMSGQNGALQQEVIKSLGPSVPGEELKQLAIIQAKGVSKANIPPTLAAKYVERAQYVASRTGRSLPTNLVNTAKTFHHPDAAYSKFNTPQSQQAFVEDAKNAILGLLK